jgi:hypothetical protein
VKSEWITVFVVSGALGAVMLVGTVVTSLPDRSEADTAMQEAALAWRNGDHGQTPRSASPPSDLRDFDISQESTGPFLPYEEWVEQQQKATRESQPATAKPLMRAKEYDKKAARKWAEKKTGMPSTDPLSPFLSNGGPDFGGDCTPGYEPCLPLAYDYDCRYGRGNGPSFTGEVRVLGPDRYRLDDDGDGWGCDGQ